MVVLDPLPVVLEVVPVLMVELPSAPPDPAEEKLPPQPMRPRVSATERIEIERMVDPTKIDALPRAAQWRRGDPMCAGRESTRATCAREPRRAELV
jgi:hypothetical protein